MNVSNGFKRTFSVIFALISAVILGSILDSKITSLLVKPDPTAGNFGGLGIAIFFLFVWPISAALTGLVTYLLLSTLIKTFLQKGIPKGEPTKLKSAAVKLLLSFLSIIMALILAGVTTRLFAYLMFERLFTVSRPDLINQGWQITIILHFFITAFFAAVAFIIFTIIFLKMSHKLSSKKS